MSGLRLSNLNKETTYLLTYLLTFLSTESNPNKRVCVRNYVMKGFCPRSDHALSEQISCGYKVMARTEARGFKFSETLKFYRELPPSSRKQCYKKHWLR